MTNVTKGYIVSFHSMEQEFESYPKSTVEICSQIHAILICRVSMALRMLWL